MAVDLLSSGAATASENLVASVGRQLTHPNSDCPSTDFPKWAYGVIIAAVVIFFLLCTQPLPTHSRPA